MSISRVFLLRILLVALLTALAFSQSNAFALNLGNLALARVVMLNDALAAHSAEQWLEFGNPSVAKFRSLTRLYLARGQTAQAIQAGEQAVTLNPGDLLSSYWLGQAYWVSGDKDSARNAWRAGGALQARLDRLLQLCWQDTGLGNLDAAESALRQAMDLDPEWGPAYDALASLQWGHDWAKVSWALDRALSYSQAGTAEWYWNKGRQYILKGDWASAVAALRASVKLQPAEWPMRFLADALEQSGNQTEADQIRQAIESRLGK